MIDARKYNEQHQYSFGYGPFEAAGLTSDQVEAVVHEWWLDEHSTDTTMMMVFTTPEGKWGYFEAWVDYTGWDCRAGASALVYADSEEELVSELSADARRKFGYEETPDCGV